MAFSKTFRLDVMMQFFAAAGTQLNCRQTFFFQVFLVFLKTSRSAVYLKSKRIQSLSKMYLAILNVLKTSCASLI